MIRRFAEKWLSQSHAKNKSALYRNLIRHEAAIGGSLFGELPEGRTREFFCMDHTTWVWQEVWYDELGNLHEQITRYQVMADKIVKSLNNQPYQTLSKQEAVRLKMAAAAYQHRVTQELYSSLLPG